MDNYIKRDGTNWDKYFLRLVKEVSTKSKDPSTKTGCIIVKNNRILTSGFNGFPVGVKDLDERYSNREIKYKMIEHCDRNAIYQAARHGIPLEGAIMYLTGQPCHECTKGIIQAGIVEVIWPSDDSGTHSSTFRDRWADSILTAQTMAEESGVKFVEIKI